MIVGNADGPELGLGAGATEGMLLGTELKVIVGPADGDELGNELGEELGAELCSGVGLDVGIADGLSLSVTVGSDEGVDDAVREGSDDAVTDGSDEAVIEGSDDGLELLVTVGNGVGFAVTGEAVGEPSSSTLTTFLTIISVFWPIPSDVEGSDDLLTDGLALSVTVGDGVWFWPFPLPLPASDVEGSDDTALLTNVLNSSSPTDPELSAVQTSQNCAIISEEIPPLPPLPHCCHKKVQTKGLIRYNIVYMSICVSKKEGK